MKEKGKRRRKEPKQLRQGKKFHLEVQENWIKDTFGDIEVEETQPAGRMDMYTVQTDGDVVIIEIKGTNWDKIKPRNVRKNLHSHRRQLFRYIDTYYLDGDGVGISAAMIYPEVPTTDDLRDIVEDYFHEYAVVVVWFNGGDAIIS